MREKICKSIDPNSINAYSLKYKNNTKAYENQIANPLIKSQKQPGGKKIMYIIVQYKKKRIEMTALTKNYSKQKTIETHDVIERKKKYVPKILQPE